jgi:hypothetical protein
MKLGRVFLCLLVGAVACGRGLPSETSLGGKLDDEALEAPRPDRRANADTEPDAAVKEAPVEAQAKSADAGAPADAAVAEKAVAEKKEEPADAGAPSPSDAGVTARWAGEYVGSDLTTTRFEGMPERVQPDDKARTKVEEPEPGRVVLIIVDSSNGSTLCTLDADATGTTANIRPGQSCFGSEGMSATVVEGRARLEGDRLTFDMEIAVEVDADDVSMEGEIDYRFDGKRI